jgi:hypothetical protein
MSASLGLLVWTPYDIPSAACVSIAATSSPLSIPLRRSVSAKLPTICSWTANAASSAAVLTRRDIFFRFSESFTSLSVGCLDNTQRSGRPGAAKAASGPFARNGGAA